MPFVRLASCDVDHLVSYLISILCLHDNTIHCIKHILRKASLSYDFNTLTYITPTW